MSMNIGHDMPYLKDGNIYW